MDYAGVSMSQLTESNSDIAGFYSTNFSAIWLFISLLKTCFVLINLLCFFFSTVCAEILKGSLSTMERHIQRLEGDIENFPKTDDQQDKFVEKMSISF